MTRDQEQLFHDRNETVDAVLDLLGEWITQEARNGVAPGLPDSERAHQCGRADSLFDFRERVYELRKATRKVN